MPLESQPPDSVSPDAAVFRCEVSGKRDTAKVRALGELDLGTVAILDAKLAELREAGFRLMIADLSGLSFIDSTGLRCILEWDAEARRGNISIALVQGPRAVQRVFELTGTAARLRFVDA